MSNVKQRHIPTIEVLVTLSDGSVVIANRFHVVWMSLFSTKVATLDQFIAAVEREIERRKVPQHGMG